ncbi:MAG: TonB-dependent receptor, partial [Mariniphaga sp.]|nr:TonB-dependent receptor [Mariniphaga sp.]
MKFNIIAVILILTTSTALAQRGSLTGMIVDKTTKENIPFATVALMKAGEQEVFTGTVSDENGKFLIDKIPFGQYDMVVSFIGYTSGEISNVSVTPENKETDLGKIEIESNVFGIEAVEVTAAARTSVNKIDRRTYRASDFETARGGTAVDILSKIPSVSVSSENDISVRGSSDFVVYLNGKPSNTSASVLLNQIPGENIENIDIITVPTSRYDAQGKGGIINITTKRNTNTGLTVLATGLLGGTPWKNGTDIYSNQELDNNRVNGGLNLNYNINGLNLHGSINYANKNNNGVFDNYTFIFQDETQLNSNTFYILDGMGTRPKWDENFYTNLGADLTLSDNAELSANYQYSERHS